MRYHVWIPVDGNSQLHVYALRAGNCVETLTGYKWEMRVVVEPCGITVCCEWIVEKISWPRNPPDLAMGLEAKTTVDRDKKPVAELNIFLGQLRIV